MLTLNALPTFDRGRSVQMCTAFDYHFDPFPTSRREAHDSVVSEMADVARVVPPA